MQHSSSKFLIIFPFLTILIVCILTPISGYYDSTWLFDWKDTRKNILDTIQAAKHSQPQLGYGESGYSEGYYRLRWLSKNATIKELELMTTYPNGSIQIAGYEGLLENSNYPFKKEKLIELTKDSSTSTYIALGCIVSRTMVKDYFIKYSLCIFTNLFTYFFILEKEQS